MPMPDTVDATTPKFLRDKYAIVGIGETDYKRGSTQTTRAMATIAVRQRHARRRAEAHRHRRHAVVSVQQFRVLAVRRRRSGHPPQLLHGRVRRRLVDRGLDRHRHRRDRGRHVQDRRHLPLDERFSPVRIGGTGARAAAPVQGDMLHARSYGWQSAGQMFAPSFMRHMYDYGTTAEQVAAVRVAHSHHASNNPKAFYKKRADGRRRGQQPHDLQAAASARLLRRDRQRQRHHRHLRRARARLQASPGADPRRCRPLLQAARRHALPDRTDLDRRRPLRQGNPLAECRCRA